MDIISIQLIKKVKILNICVLLNNFKLSYTYLLSLVPISTYFIDIRKRTEKKEWKKKYETIEKKM